MYDAITGGREERAKELAAFLMNKALESTDVGLLREIASYLYMKHESAALKPELTSKPPIVAERDALLANKAEAANHIVQLRTMNSLLRHDIEYLSEKYETLLSRHKALAEALGQPYDYDESLNRTVHSLQTTGLSADQLVVGDNNE